MTDAYYTDKNNAEEKVTGGIGEVENHVHSVPFVARTLSALGIELGHGFGYYAESALFLLMLIAISVKDPNIFAFGDSESVSMRGVAGKLGACIIVHCLKVSRDFRLPTAPVNILFVTYTIINLIDMPRYGFGSLMYRYIYQYFVIIVMVNFYGLLGAERSRHLIATGACILVILVLFNAIVHYRAFAYFYINPWDGHPNYATLFSGGVNLEATWPALLGVFFNNDRRGHVYLGCVFLFSVLVASRAGLLLSVGAAAYVLFLKGRSLRKRVWLTHVACVV